MKPLLTLSVLSLLFAVYSCSSPQTNEPVAIHSTITIPDGFEALFNGQNFDGWYVTTDGNGPDSLLFAADEGMIHAYPHQQEGSEQAFGALITTKKYQNYLLTLEFKWGSKKFKPRTDYVKDAGVLFHMVSDEVFWPSGIECQIQDGDTGDLWIIGTRASAKIDASEHYQPNGKVATKGDLETRYNRFSRSNSWEQPGWNKIEIEVREDQAKFTVNGHLVNEAINMKYWNEEASEWEPLTIGNILLQAEGAEIFYRNVYIKSL